MLRIRLKPTGRKRQITYKIVVDEKRSKLGGQSIDELGWVNPITHQCEIDTEKAKYWIETGGAKPSDRVFNILVDKEILDGPKKAVHAKSKKEPEEVSVEEGEKSVEGEEKVESNNESTENKEEENKEEKIEEKPKEDNEEKKEEETQKPKEEIEENKEEDPKEEEPKEDK
jgi:small subunit ribosomal protein S16